MTVYVKRVKVQRSVLLQKTMILPLIFCSILFLIVIVECFRKKAVKFTLPPGPKKLPFIGNLHQLAGSQLPHHRLSELMNQYGPVMHVQMGELSVVVISDPESAKEVLKNQDPNFAAKAPFVVSEMMNFDNSSLVFAPYGEYWRQMRKIVVLELLSAKRVRSYRFIREKETQILIDQIASTCGSIVNLSEKTAYYTASVFCKTAFGEDFNVNQQKELIELLRETIDLAGGFNLAEIYPSIKVFRHIHGLKRKMNLLRGKMNDMFDDILSNHKNKRDHNNNTSCSSTLQDLVDVFLRIQESNDMGISVTTNNIKGVIRDLFGAGTETSSVTLEWVMSELLKNPTVMNKAQTEVREVLNLKGKKHIEESDVEELKYLKLVIKETLRLHPPGPLFPREARQNCKINGYDVPAKTRSLVNLWAIGRDPRYWSNPDKFEPQRFVDSSVDFNGSHFHLLPFGAGKRMCPGIVFATASMEMVLAALLYHFDWKLPNGRNFEDLDMEEARGAHSNRQNNLCVIATKMH